MSDYALDEILARAVTDSGADMGNIQLLNAAGQLQIVTSLGFDWRFLSHFDSVQEGHAACGGALESATRIVVENVASSPIFDEKSRRVMLAARALACQSTPLQDTAGRVIGMLSTHRRVVGAFAADIWTKVDALAAKAAETVQQAKIVPGSLSWSTARSRLLIDSVQELFDASSPRPVPSRTS